MNVTVTLSNLRVINLIIQLHSFHTVVVGKMKGLWIYSLSIWIPCPPCIGSTQRHRHKVCAQALCVGSTWWLQLHMPSKGFLPWTSKCCFTLCIPVFQNFKSEQTSLNTFLDCSDWWWAGWLGRQGTLCHHIRLHSGAYPASCPVGTEGPFPRGDAEPFTSIQCPG